MQTIEETLHMLVQHITQEGRGNPQRLPPQSQNHHEDRLLKVDIKDFDGHSHNPEDYLEWESSLERYFEYMETPPEKQYRIAKMSSLNLLLYGLKGCKGLEQGKIGGELRRGVSLKSF